MVNLSFFLKFLLKVCQKDVREALGIFRYLEIVGLRENAPSSVLKITPRNTPTKIDVYNFTLFEFRDQNLFKTKNLTPLDLKFSDISKNKTNFLYFINNVCGLMCSDQLK